MKILVGTDFTETAEKALGQAFSLAKATGGTLHLVHVVEPIDEPDSSDPETEAFYNELIQKSQTHLKEVCRRLGVPEDCTSVLIGHRVQVLRELADQLEVDLIVLGSRPLTDPPERLGVSHRVALISSRPVLLVP